MFDFLTNKLRIKNNRLVGKIYHLEKKLNGEIPITRLELFHLVNSWGRDFVFMTEKSNELIFINKMKQNEKYNLSKLNTSEIIDMSYLFMYSRFNGDISQWDVSNVTNMENMFREAHNFNSNIENWNVSNVTNMNSMFYSAEKFNQNISSWNLDNVIDCDSMLFYTKAFEKKYNYNLLLSYHTTNLKNWLNENRDRMKAIDVKDKYGKEIDDFFHAIRFYSQNRYR